MSAKMLFYFSKAMYKGKSFSDRCKFYFSSPPLTALLLARAFSSDVKKRATRRVKNELDLRRAKCNFVFMLLFIFGPIIFATKLVTLN